MMLVISNELYAHALATTLAFAAWAVLSRTGAARSQVAAAGALTGAAVLVEYPFLVFVLIYAAYLLTNDRPWTRVGWFATGGVPLALALGAYQFVSFGNPLQNSYSEKAATQGDSFTLGLPDPSTLAKVVAGSRGWVWMPVILIGAGAAIGLARDRTSPARRHGMVAVAVAATLLFLQGGWPNPWGGEVPFPRYTYAVLPFLAVPLATYWQAWRPVILIATGLGAVRMTLPLITYHLLPHGGDYFATYRLWLEEWGVSPTTFTIAFGPAGWAIHAATVAGLLVLLFRERDRVTPLGQVGGGSGPAPPADADPTSR